jgi:hypothetical protein
MDEIWVSRILFFNMLSYIYLQMHKEIDNMVQVCYTRRRTSLGSPHNRRKWKSDSDTTMPGASLSAPLGFVGT